MKLKDYCARLVKFSYRWVTRKAFLPPECDIDRESVNREMFNLLAGDRPCMISRFGTTELNCINNYLCIASDKRFLRKLRDYVTDHTHTPWWNEKHFHFMNVYSGIFPPGKETSKKFAERYLEDIPLIDLLGSFQYYEKFMPLSSGVYRAQLETLYPFFVKNPWMRALRGKKVLVVHPFDQSIRDQYQKRTALFQDPDVLPDFELITFRAVQSVGGAKVPFRDWFDALAYMEQSISKIDFDVCILGCGAYGLPLAAHVKRMGKKAIHLGGGTQLLFGIKGRRWEVEYEDILEYRPGELINVDYRALFNSSWVYPDESERPEAAALVENACYW